MNARTATNAPDGQLQLHAAVDATAPRYYIPRRFLAGGWDIVDGRVVWRRRLEVEVVAAHGVMARLRAERAQRGRPSGGASRGPDTAAHATAPRVACLPGPRRAAGSRGTSYGGRS